MRDVLASSVRALLCVLHLNNNRRLSGVFRSIGRVCFALTACYCGHLMPVDIGTHPLFYGHSFAVAHFRNILLTQHLYHVAA